MIPPPNYAGGAKDSDEPEVALRRRKTTPERSQPREYGQLLHRWEGSSRIPALETTRI